MNYEKFYDQNAMCLKTEIVTDSEIEARRAGEKHPGGPVKHHSVWYSGFIDKSCFPDNVHVSYKPEGWTGPETRVDYDGVVPQCEFEILP